jgi:hypothetical protein
MTMKTRTCERDDLRAIIPQPSYWTVDSNGDADEHVSDGSFYDLEQYHCVNCGNCWMPDDPNRVSEWEAVWQEALGHLTIQEAA